MRIHDRMRGSPKKMQHVLVEVKPAPMTVSLTVPIGTPDEAILGMAHAKALRQLVKEVPDMTITDRKEG